jgi:hypothetical protein
MRWNRNVSPLEDLMFKLAFDKIYFWISFEINLSNIWKKNGKPSVPIILTSILDFNIEELKRSSNGSDEYVSRQNSSKGLEYVRLDVRVHVNVWIESDTFVFINWPSYWWTSDARSQSNAMIEWINSMVTW